MAKNKKTLTLTLIAVFTLIVLFIVGYFIWQLNNKKNEVQILPNQINKNNCLADDCLVVNDLNYPVSQLSDDVIKSLNEAIDDEYKALTMYQVVISKFGQVRPFSMIKGAEEQHIAMLKAIYDKYGLKVPENNWINKITAPSTLQEACQVGVDAEIANAALYNDKLLPSVIDHEDITQVFTNLMNASSFKHLPAFEKCK